jgi:hypothetical protein
MEYSAIDVNNYSVDGLLTDLENGILSEIKSRKSVDQYRRNLQKMYVSNLIDLLKPGKTTLRSIQVGATNGFTTRSIDLNDTDLPSIVRGHLNLLKSNLKSAINVQDKMSQYHYEDLLGRVSMALEPK